jgi:hypothetical protein
MFHQLPKVRSVVKTTIIASLVIAGCGGSEGPLRGTVAGNVTLDGTPLKSGVIRFIPTGQTKGPAAAATIKEGAYALGRDEGPIVGTHRVEIEATDYTDFAIDDERAYAQRAAQGKPAIPKNPVPEIYNSRSQLTAEVPAEGNQTLDFRLDTKGGVVGAR